MEVTVDHVKALDETSLLRQDYGQSFEKFRNVSKLKKALDQAPIRPGSKTRAPSQKSDPTPRVTPDQPPFDLNAVRKAVTPQQLAAEETKLLKVDESLRIFVRVADPKFRQVVPMRFFNLTLTPAEADAYCADYLEEKSLRAGVARVLLRLVAVTARIITEWEELKRASNSSSLWKLHADSLATLLQIASNAAETAERLSLMAGQRGQREHQEEIHASLKKLREYSGIAERSLAGSGELQGKAAGAN
jgi:hypothetical protein